jgi:hypothetical protein
MLVPSRLVYFTVVAAFIPPLTLTFCDVEQATANGVSVCLLFMKTE